MGHLEGISNTGDSRRENKRGDSTDIRITVVNITSQGSNIYNVMGRKQKEQYSKEEVKCLLKGLRVRTEALCRMYS